MCVCVNHQMSSCYIEIIYYIKDLFQLLIPILTVIGCSGLGSASFRKLSTRASSSSILVMEGIRMPLDRLTWAQLMVGQLENDAFSIHKYRTPPFFGTHPRIIKYHRFTDIILGNLHLRNFLLFHLLFYIWDQFRFLALKAFCFFFRFFTAKIECQSLIMFSHS